MNEDYIKRIESENKFLNQSLRASFWFQGIDKIKEPHLNYIESKGSKGIIIEAGWFWFTPQGPKEVAAIESSMEIDSIKKPLMCSIYFISPANEEIKDKWILYDGGAYKHPLDTYKNYWFAGPLIPPYRDLTDERILHQKT